MMKQVLLAVLLCGIGFTTIIFGQDITQLQAIALDSALTTNANAVIRSYDLVIEVHSVASVTIKNRRIVTVLNKKGERSAGTYEHYDLGTKIKRQEATFYNAFGKEIKKYRKNNFEDQSTTSGHNLVTDNRVKYIDYTPVSYPYTVVYESELNYDSTVFIRPWFPIEDYRISVENATYELLNPNKIPFRFKENGFFDYERL